jgi:hypothetical protein
MKMVMIPVSSGGSYFLLVFFCFLCARSSVPSLYFFISLYIFMSNSPLYLPVPLAFFRVPPPLCSFFSSLFELSLFFFSLVCVFGSLSLSVFFVLPFFAPFSPLREVAFAQLL